LEDEDYQEESGDDYVEEKAQEFEEMKGEEEKEMENENDEEEIPENQPEEPEIEEAPDPPIVSLVELTPGMVKRAKLEKWYGEPYWERAVRGLFVRVMVGQDKDTKSYRIAEIIKLVDCSSYKLGKKECNQLVTLKIGDKTKNFEMKYLSNELPTEAEFNIWAKWNKKLNEALPTKKNI